MRRASRALALALLPLVALVAVGCTSDDDAEAATPEPFVPVSPPVETEAGLLLVDRDSVAPALSSAVRLQSRTLDALPGEQPMQRPGALDPSGRWMAVPDPSRAWGQSANVLVYDLSTWELAWRVDDLPSGLLSWEANELLWWGDHCEVMQNEGACGDPWVRGVWRLTPEGAEELVRFDFAPYPAPGIADSNEHAYVIGIDTQLSSGIDPEGDAFLAILDLSAGIVEATIPLPDLLVGQPGHWLGSTDHSFGGVYRPEAVLSADEALMYIAHAEADRITVVDLAERQVVETHTLREDDSAASRLGGWLRDQLTSTAEAKMAAEYLRQAQLTPDGRYLLMSGSAVAEKPSEVATDEFVETAPRGLLVVDLATMDIVHEDDTTGQFVLSPNGYTLLGWGRMSPMEQPVGLTVLDLRTLAETRLRADDYVTSAFASPDGRTGYLVTGHYLLTVGNLIAFDLDTFEVLAERPLQERDWPSGLEFSR